MNNGKANLTRCFQIVPSVMLLIVERGKILPPFCSQIVCYELRGVKYFQDIVPIAKIEHVLFIVKAVIPTR